jgi:hypothetical protein
MNTGRLLIAAAVMAVLGGVLWWSNKEEAASAGKPAKDAPPKILELKEADIKSLEIKPREGDAVKLTKADDGKWSITAPSKLVADNAAVTSILTSASNLSSDRMIDENPTDLPGYGLEPPATQITFGMADGKSRVLKIGDPTPTGNGVYAMAEGDKRLFTMASYNKDSLAKTAKDLREKHLMTFDQEKLSRVELSAAGKTPVEFGRIGQTEWQILKPKPLRADGWQVEDILSKVKGVTLNADVDPKTAASGFAAAKPVATVKVTGPEGEKTIEIRKGKDDVYAKSSAVEGVFKVNKESADGLEKSVDDFRAKKLFDFGFNDPTRIDYKDGARMFSVEKSGDKWKSGGKEMDSVSVQNLIDKLRDLSASKFVESGFTTPQIEITVASNEGKRTEKIQIAPAGSNFIAKRENDASLYELTGDSVRDLRQSGDGVREPAPADDKNKKK